MAYSSSVRLLVSFYYSNSQTASFSLECRSSLLPQISANLASGIAVLAFWLVSVTHIYKENRFHPTSSIVPVQKYENPRYPSSVSRQVSFYYFYLQKALSLLKCSSSLPVQISRSPAFSSSANLLVSFCFFFPQRALFILNYRSCLPIQISKSSESFWSVFVAFIQGKVLSSLNCCSSLSVYVSRRLGYWSRDRL